MRKDDSGQRPYLSVSEIVETGIMSRTTIWRKIKSGELEAIKIGQTVRIPRESLERFIDAHRIGGGAR